MKCLLFTQEFVTSSTASLNIKNSVRKDSGIYKIEAKNDYGIDMADIEVIVVSKPGPPTGPIDYTTVTPDSVSMSWKPPLDDGGTPITGKLINEQTCNKILAVLMQKHQLIKLTTLQKDGVHVLFDARWERT